jgi:hypothetical protein
MGGIGSCLSNTEARVTSGRPLVTYFCVFLISLQDENGTEGQPTSLPEPDPIDDYRPIKRPRFGEQDLETPTLSIKPLGQTHRSSSASKVPQPVASPAPAVVEARSTKPTKQDLAAIIAAASAAATPEKPISSASNGHADVAKKPSKDSPKKTQDNKEKRLLKLVGAVVVKCMSKYQSQMDHEVFKKHAKEVMCTFCFLPFCSG